MRAWRYVAAVLLVGVLASCGQEAAPPTAADPTPTDAPESESRPPSWAGDQSGPPPLTLHAPEGEMDLAPYTFCFTDEDAGASMCADGLPPDDPPRTAADGPLTVSFPLEGWSFTAAFSHRGSAEECARLLSIAAEDQGDGTYVLPALGPAGTWDVDLGGYGPEGDLFTTFRWTTAAGSTTTSPATGVVSFLGPPSIGRKGDKPEAYGPDLRLTGLEADPVEATAELVLTDGSVSATYPMELARGDGCPDDGLVSFQGKAFDKPATLPDLGDPPWRQEVHLTMDGVTYVGTGEWPGDLDPPSSNQLTVTWDPPLPAYHG